MQLRSEAAARNAREWMASYLSLFTSLGTLVCCALPSLLVLLGLGATVASMLSFMPWLVTLSRHKAWVFAISGALITLSLAQVYVIAPHWKKSAETCPPNDPTCDRATRVARVVLWIAAVIYLIGFCTAYLLGPFLARMDGG